MKRNEITWLWSDLFISICPSVRRSVCINIWTYNILHISMSDMVSWLAERKTLLGALVSTLLQYIKSVLTFTPNHLLSLSCLKKKHWNLIKAMEWVWYHLLKLPVIFLSDISVCGRRYRGIYYSGTCVGSFCGFTPIGWLVCRSVINGGKLHFRAPIKALFLFATWPNGPTD